MERSGVEASVVKLKQVEQSGAELKAVYPKFLIKLSKAERSRSKFVGFARLCHGLLFQIRWYVIKLHKFSFLTAEQSATKANLISRRIKCSEALV